MIEENLDNSIVLLTLEACKTISEREKQWNADFDLRHKGRLESAIGSVNLKSQLIGLEVLDIAAAYFVHIACGHVFVDGNKRFSVTFMVYFLELNKLKLKLTKNALRNLAIKICHERNKDVPIHIRRDYIRDVLKENILPLI